MKDHTDGIDVTRYLPQAQDRDKFHRMLKVLSRAESKEELEQASLLYVMDMSFPRPDICLVMKAIETSRGW